MALEFGLWIGRRVLNMLRNWGSAVVAVALIAASSSALAAGTQQGVLAPGHAAAVHKAQLYLFDGQYIWVVGGVIVGTGLAAASAASDAGYNAITTTSCPASQCPSTGTTTSTSTSTPSTTGT